MLQNIGDKLKSQRWLGMLVLGILAVIFAMWGAYGIVDLTFGAPNYAAKVNGEEIAAATVQNAWQQQQASIQQQLQNDIPVEQRKLLQQSLLDSFIDNTVLRQRARERGLRASDSQIRRAFELEPQFQVDGKFSRAAADGLLAQAGLTLAGYEASKRQELPTEQLRAGIQGTDFLTDKEIARYFALENEQREVRYALLAAARYEAAAKLDDAAVQAWYQANLDEYQSPESVRLQYAMLQLADMKASVKVEEKALTAWFEKNQARYVEPEKRNARHVLIKLDAGAEAAADAAARKKADEVLAQARAGKNFAQLAQQYSDDPGTKSKGGELGWAGKGQYVPAFEDALWSLQAGALSDVVKTNFGYHIIKLDGVQASRGKTLATARAEIEGHYRDELAADAFGDAQEKLQQRLEGSGDSDLAAIAREFGMASGEIAAYTRTGAAPLGSSTDLNALLFGASAIDLGRLGGPVALGTERIVVVKPLARQPAAALPLAAVREQVVAALRKDAGSKAAMAAADGAVQRLAAGADINVVLRELGVTAAPAAWIGRGDPQLPVQVREAAFATTLTAGKPAYQSLGMEGGGAALLSVTAIRPGTAGANPTNDQQQRNQYFMRMTDAQFAAFQRQLRAAAKIQSNDALFTN